MIEIYLRDSKGKGIKLAVCSPVEIRQLRSAVFKLTNIIPTEQVLFYEGAELPKSGQLILRKQSIVHVCERSSLPPNNIKLQLCSFLFVGETLAGKIASKRYVTNITSNIFDFICKVFEGTNKVCDKELMRVIQRGRFLDLDMTFQQQHVPEHAMLFLIEITDNDERKDNDQRMKEENQKIHKMLEEYMKRIRAGKQLDGERQSFVDSLKQKDQKLLVFDGGSSRLREAEKMAVKKEQQSVEQSQNSEEDRNTPFADVKQSVSVEENEEEMESVSGVSGREWITQKLKMNRDGDGYRDRDSQKNIDVKMKENMVVTHTEKIVMKEKESSIVSMKEIIVEKQHIVNEQQSVEDNKIDIKSDLGLTIGKENKKELVVVEKVEEQLSGNQKEVIVQKEQNISLEKEEEIVVKSVKEIYDKQKSQEIICDKKDEQVHSDNNKVTITKTKEDINAEKERQILVEKAEDQIAQNNKRIIPESDTQILIDNQKQIFADKQTKTSIENENDQIIMSDNKTMSLGESSVKDQQESYVDNKKEILVENQQNGLVESQRNINFDKQINIQIVQEKEQKVFGEGSQEGQIEKKKEDSFENIQKEYKISVQYNQNTVENDKIILVENDKQFVTKEKEIQQENIHDETEMKYQEIQVTNQKANSANSVETYEETPVQQKYQLVFEKENLVDNCQNIINKHENEIMDDRNIPVNNEKEVLADNDKEALIDNEKEVLTENEMRITANEQNDNFVEKEEKNLAENDKKLVQEKQTLVLKKKEEISIQNGEEIVTKEVQQDQIPIEDAKKISVKNISDVHAETEKQITEKPINIQTEIANDIPVENYKEVSVKNERKNSVQNYEKTPVEQQNYFNIVKEIENSYENGEEIFGSDEKQNSIDNKKQNSVEIDRIIEENAKDILAQNDQIINEENENNKQPLTSVNEKDNGSLVINQQRVLSVDDNEEYLISIRVKQIPAEDNIEGALAERKQGRVVKKKVCFTDNKNEVFGENWEANFEEKSDSKIHTTESLIIADAKQGLDNLQTVELELNSAKNIKCQMSAQFLPTEPLKQQPSPQKQSNYLSLQDRRGVFKQTLSIVSELTQQDSKHGDITPIQQQSLIAQLLMTTTKTIFTGADGIEQPYSRSIVVPTSSKLFDNDKNDENDIKQCDGNGVQELRQTKININTGAKDLVNQGQERNLIQQKQAQHIKQQTQLKDQHETDCPSAKLMRVIKTVQIQHIANSGSQIPVQEASMMAESSSNSIQQQFQLITSQSDYIIDDLQDNHPSLYVPEEVPQVKDLQVDTNLVSSQVMMSEGIIENDTSLLANKNSAVDMGELKSERYSLQVLGNTGTENRKNRLTKRYSLQPGTQSLITKQGPQNPKEGIKISSPKKGARSIMEPRSYRLCNCKPRSFGQNSPVKRSDSQNRRKRISFQESLRTSVNVEEVMICVIKQT